MPRLALYALTVCVLATAAAAASFARASWLGIVWVLLAGLSSNMAWYYLRRTQTGKRPRKTTARPAPAGACGSSAACGVCVKSC